MASQHRRIVIIDDASDATSIIMRSCEKLHAKVIKYNCNAYGIGQLCEKKWDLLIVSISNNIHKSIEICETVRSAKRWSQIMIVSDINDDTAIAECLSSGADDYVIVPFSVVEFKARVTAALRRSIELQPILNKINKSTIIKSDSNTVTEIIEIYPTSGHVVIAGSTIQLTQSELQILSYLVDNADRFCSKHELLEKVLGYKDEVYLPSLYSHISRLRRKFIEHNLKSVRVETAWRSGYRLTTTYHETPTENVSHISTEMQMQK